MDRPRKHATTEGQGELRVQKQPGLQGGSCYEGVLPQEVLRSWPCEQLSDAQEGPGSVRAEGCLVADQGQSRPGGGAGRARPDARRVEGGSEDYRR